MVFFLKPKTTYELRISDLSSDVCSSDLRIDRRHLSPILDDARDLDRLFGAARADADPRALRDAAQAARPDRAQGPDRGVLRPLLRPFQRLVRAHHRPLSGRCGQDARGAAALARRVRGYGRGDGLAVHPPAGTVTAAGRSGLRSE